MSRRSGLGRGLAALIPPSSPPQETRDDVTEDRSTDRSDRSSDDDPGEAPAAGPGGEPETATTVTGPSPSTGPDTSTGPTTQLPTPRTAAALAAAAGSPDAAPGTPDGHDPAAGEPDTTTDPGVTLATAADPAPDAPLNDEGATDARSDGADGANAPADDDGGAATPASSADDGTVGRGPWVASSAATLAELDLTDIVPNPRQPREVFDPEELEGLATSLADIGVLQPLVVRPLPDGRYELIAGERRLRAAKLAGIDRVPAVVRHTDDADLLKEALVENIHRVQLNPLEEGAAYQQLLDEFGVTQEELATNLGRSRPAISNAIRLLQLPTAVQRRVAAGVLSAGHAKALLSVEDPGLQAKLADRIVAEGLSVRATEELVRLRMLEGGPDAAASSRRRGPTAPGLVELQEDLSDALMARVRISMGARKGKLAIEFASVDDLERIVAVIANGLQGGERPETGQPADSPLGDGWRTDPDVGPDVGQDDAPER